MKRTLPIVTMSLLFASAPAYADQISGLIVSWQDENNLCRGSTDPNVVEKSCERRDQIASELRDAGLCMGKYLLDSPDPNIGFLLRERWVPCLYRDLTD